MNSCKQCGSLALNDDPQKLLCDRCWRDDQIVAQKAEITRLKTACAEFGTMILKNEQNPGYLPRGYGKAKNRLFALCRQLAREKSG
jgi:hypothetical protein